MPFTLTEQEIKEVRFLSKSQETATLHSISDEVLQGVSQEGVDYVFEQVLESFDTSQLDATQKGYIDNRDIENFMSDILSDALRTMFRRAIVLRTSGIVITGIEVPAQYGAGGVSDRITTDTPLKLQQNLFERADQQILRIRNAFVDDAIKSPLAKYKLFDITNSC